MADRSCFVCSAPIAGVPTIVTIGTFFIEKPTHRRCAVAWCEDDRQAILNACEAACSAGHHKYPGEWTKDPADQYGDAAFWECGHGCGYRCEHEGYGIGRRIAGVLVAHPTGTEQAMVERGAR